MPLTNGAMIPLGLIIACTPSARAAAPAGSVSAAGAAPVVGGPSGFDALLAGGTDFRGKYLHMGECGFFWNSTEVNGQRAYHHHVGGDGDAGRSAARKGERIAVGCIKDQD